MEERDDFIANSKIEPCVFDNSKQVEVLDANIPDAPTFHVYSVAVKTLFWVVVAGVLLFVNILYFFPYNTMRIFSNIGQDNRALIFAERYIDAKQDDYNSISPEPDSKFADARLLAVNNSIILMNKRVTQKGYGDAKASYYAEKATKHIDEYLKFNTAGSLGDRSKLIDEYSLKKFRAMPYMHPRLSVYNFANYIQVQRYRSQLLLGNKDELYLQHVNETTATWDDENFAVPTGTERNDVYVLFAQINEYIHTELDQLGLYALTPDQYGLYDRSEVTKKIKYPSGKRSFGFFIENSGNFTALYTRISKHFEAFKSDLQQTTDKTSASKMLPNLYFVNILNELAQNFYNMALVVEANIRYYNVNYESKLNALRNDWLTHYRISGEKIWMSNTELNANYLSDWYALGLLHTYTQLVAKEVL